MTGLRWDHDWRTRVWSDLDAPWDVVVVGGGVLGAGVLREAARSGLRALLLEAGDFACGTSSRSSQLVHGGLRYLAQGHVRLTRDSVRERERLLREAAGLVEPVPFLLPLHRGGGRRELAYRPLVAGYEALAGRRPRSVSVQDVQACAPSLHTGQLRGALRYTEGTTDDARLVLRVLREAAALGAVALNGAEVTGLLQRGDRVTGVRARDRRAGCAVEVPAGVVVNATGVWSDRLRGRLGASPQMRPVRGSHLLFPAERFPLATGVVVRSPRDGRPVSVFPWQGATLVGTTDLDHTGPLSAQISITADEVAYLLECLDAPFRSLQLTADDVLSTWSGVRPIVSTQRSSSAQEARDHAVWTEGGLITVAGGKLTTFRLAARDALRAAVPHLRPPATAPRGAGVPAGADRRLSGRYGPELPELRAAAQPDDSERVGGTATTWAELRWAAQREAVTALEDLMLRRTRLGLLLPRGGEAVLDRVREVCRAELGWDAARWEQERASYLATVRGCCSLPAGTSTVSASGTASTVTGSGPNGSPSA